MTEDNYNLGELHPDLVEIIDTAESEIMSDVMDSVARDFTEIEQFMWDKLGDPDGEGSIWNVVVLADNTGDAMDAVVNMDPETTIQMNKPDDLELGTGEEMGLLGIEAIGAYGNVYDGLLNAHTMLAVAERDPVGLLIRVGGHGSSKAQDENVRPSEASDRFDVVVSVLCTSAAVYSIVRKIGSDEKPIMDMTKITDVEVGQSRLVDAVMMTYMAPRVVRDLNSPEMYQSFLEDLRKATEE